MAELLGVDIETLQTVAGDARRDVRTEAYTAMLFGTTMPSARSFTILNLTILAYVKIKIMKTRSIFI